MQTGEGTIQTDVSENQKQQEQQERPRSQREVMLESIEERVDEQRQGQFHQEAAPDTTRQENQPVVVDDPQQFMVRVKVDGKEELKPLSEVVGSYQKNEVASERLRQASMTRKELEAWENNLKEKERQIELAGTVSEQTDPDDGLNEALGALVEGDTATAAQVIREMVNKGRQQTTPQVDEAAIAARVKEQIAGETEWDRFLRDNPEFREEFDDAGNTIVTRERQYGDFVFERDFAGRVEKGELSYLEALNATAQEVRKVFSPPPAEVTQETQQTAAQKKLERKKAIDNIPVAAGARAAGAAAEVDETPSDVIANMRKARGLPG